MSATAAANPAGPRGGGLPDRVDVQAGTGPRPHAAMVLADLGAEIVRVYRAGGPPDDGDDRHPTLRGRRRIVTDLKTPAGRDAVLDLAGHADVLVEGVPAGQGAHQLLQLLLQPASREPIRAAET